MKANFKNIVIGALGALLVACFYGVAGPQLEAFLLGNEPWPTLTAVIPHITMAFLVCMTYYNVDLSNGDEQEWLFFWSGVFLTELGFLIFIQWSPFLLGTSSGFLYGIGLTLLLQNQKRKYRFYHPD
jgi:hypothetical protein